MYFYWREWVLLPLATLVFFFTGCSLGPSALRSDRAAYNIAVQRSANEQMLLNLVRLKYRESALFLEIGAISSHFSYSANASFAATLPEGAPNTFAVGTGAGYAEQPTVTYAPLQGEQFASRLLEEINFATFLLLLRGGWDVDVLMRILNHEDASTTLRYLRQSGLQNIDVFKEMQEGA